MGAFNQCIELLYSKAIKIYMLNSYNVAFSLLNNGSVVVRNKRGTFEYGNINCIIS